MTAQQTHEKNLAWIDEALEISREDDAETGRMYGWDNFESNGTKSLRANRKVLERHGPQSQNPLVADFYGGEIEVVCDSCFEPSEDGESPCSIAFPCLTYTDITEGLGIK